MKPPLARKFSSGNWGALGLLGLIGVGLVVLTFGVLTNPAQAADGAMISAAADVGRSVARDLTALQLVGLIALGFIPAFYMIARARRNARRTSV